MICPYCGSPVNRVVDKRSVIGSGEIRRRRECLKCSRRFTTYERLASIELLVIKRDGRREPFIREKLRTGIEKALEKRPGADKVDELVDKIERKLRKRGLQEVATKLIGQMVLSELKKLDMIAYLRFVSVYRRFEQPEDFTKELQGLS
jgi:transcriptional repressor NrdR